MSTSYSANLGLGTPAPNDRGWGDVMARDLDLLDGCAPIASLHAHPAEYPSTTLVVGVSAGRWRKADGSPGSYAGGTIALPASATRRIYLDDAGTLQAAASYPVGLHVPIATATTGATAVATIVDDRVAAQAVGVGSGGQLGGLVVAAKEAPSSTLNVSVTAGRYLAADGSAATYAGTSSRTLSASTTTVVYLDAAGALQAAASYPAAALVRLATVTTGASSVTAIVDDRVAIVTTAPPGAAAYLALTGGTMTDGATIAVGSTAGLKIGTASGQKIGLYGATPVGRSAAYSTGYATTTRSFPSYTAATAGAPYSGIAGGGGGSPYASVTDLNTLRAAYENLRTFAEAAAQRQNALVADLKAFGVLS